MSLEKWNTRIIRNVGMTGQRTYFTIEITRTFTLKKAKHYSEIIDKLLMKEVPKSTFGEKS